MSILNFVRQLPTGQSPSLLLPSFITQYVPPTRAPRRRRQPPTDEVIRARKDRRNFLARERRRIRREAEEARRVEIIRRNAERERETVQEQAFLAGDEREVFYNTMTNREYVQLLDRYRDNMQDGTRYVMQYGDKYRTMTMSNIGDSRRQAISKMIKSGESVEGLVSDGFDPDAMDGEDYGESDDAASEEATGGGGVTVMNVRSRSGGAYGFAGGAYFPYLHDYECSHLTDILQNIGCWKTIVKENYKDNCLVLALRSAGVASTICNTLKTECHRRIISMKHLKNIANDNDLHISVFKNGRTTHYNNTATTRVPLALYQEHYIHLYKTDIQTYALKNYNTLKCEKDWWKFRAHKNRKNNGDGMDTLDFLKCIVEQGDHVHRISAKDDAIFQTQFYDKISNEFDTLEYPERCSVRHHPVRNGGHELELKEPINVQLIDDAVLYIKKRMHSIPKEGASREQEKVLEVLDFLLRLKHRTGKDGMNRVKYYFKDMIGRLYAKGGSKTARSKSMQGCFKGLRALCIGHKGFDIDIENSLPVLTVQWLTRLSKEIDVEFDELSNYVQDRDKYINMIMKFHDCDRDQAKTLILIILFGGSSENCYHLTGMNKNKHRFCAWLRKLDDELFFTRSTVCKYLKDKFPDVWQSKYEEKGGDIHAVERAFFAVMTHAEEHKCMEAIRDHLLSNKVEIYSWIHDGMIVSLSTSELLRGAEVAVLNETGYAIRLSEKPLFGKQTQWKDCEELSCIKNVEPRDDYQEYGFVDIGTVFKEITNGRPVVFENRSEGNLFGIKNYGEIPGLLNSSDGDAWDIVCPGYTNRLPFKTEYKVKEILGYLHLDNGNHKTFVRLVEEGGGFDEKLMYSQLTTYVCRYPKSVDTKGRWRTDMASFLIDRCSFDDDDCCPFDDDDCCPFDIEPENEDDEEEKNKRELSRKKLEATIRKMYKKYKDGHPDLYNRLLKKIRHLKYGLREEAALLSKSRPVESDIFFDFETATKQSLNDAVIIERCKAKIRSLPQHDKVLERLSKKAEGKTIRETAEIYTEACPHVPYALCWSAFDDINIQCLTGTDCAKKFLDVLCEQYGVEVGPDSAPSKDVPTIRLLAHNLTYDISFIWPYLSRVNVIERGTSIVSGRCRYRRFGSDRVDVDGACQKKCPNLDLVRWMKDVGASWYFDDPECGEGRRMHPGTWTRAMRGVEECETFLGEYSDFKREVKGIGKVISGIVEFAPFDSFTESHGFCLDKIVDIRFNDTLKMIPMPLSDFGKAFNIPQCKDVMPYDLYTEEFIENGFIATREDLKRTVKREEWSQTMTNLNEWECAVDGGFDMLRYSCVYCRKDVETLREGYKCFRDKLLTKFDIDCFHYPTISSLADTYLTERGCYDGLHSLSGVVQMFISMCSVGGRVMCANNEPVAFVNGEEQFADYDGVSLYPSSMYRLGGFLRGAPKVWDSSVDLSKCDGYFLKIKVNTIRKKWRFPICRVKKDGGNLWTNDLDKEPFIHVDRWTLEDLIKHGCIQDGDYEILQGYYFDQGRNDTIKDVILELFEMRLECKKSCPPLAYVIKNLMNSSYGICGLKRIETETVYKDDSEYDNFVDLHYNRFKDWCRMPNGQWRFELYKEVDSHQNRIHVACEILSVSKNIMNEVTCLAESENLLIAYTDTDSLQMRYSDVPKLEEAFQNKYGRSLKGKKLGEFHVDFDFASCYSNVKGELVKCPVKSEGDIRAVKSVFLGKKSYIHLLEDGSKSQTYHIRLKGVPMSAIRHKITTDFKGNAVNAFLDLFNHKPIDFDMTSGGGVMFKQNKNHTVCSGHMIRTVKF